MRFIQISLIGVLSSLQGCTKETPVPQLPSQSTTSLDASSLSTTISSGPNSLRSSHQSKLVPSTSKSIKIDGSVDESSHIVSPTTNSIKSNSDRIDVTVHNGSNQEVEKRGVSQNEIVSEVRVGQSTEPALGIQTVGPPPSVHSSVHSTTIQDGDNLDEQPGLEVLRGEQSLHPPSSSGESTLENDPGRLLNEDQVLADVSHEEHQGVLTDEPISLQDPRTEELDEQQGGSQNQIVSGIRVDQLTDQTVPEDIGGNSRPIQSVHSSVDSPNQDDDILDREPQQRSDQVQNDLRNAAVFQHNPSGQSSVEPTEDHVTDVSGDREVRMPQQGVDGSRSDHETVSAHDAIVAELRQRQSDIMQQMQNVGNVSENETVEMHIEFIRNTLNAAN